MEKKFKMGKIINKILKRLTPERIKKEIEAIQRIKLPLELQKWVKEYEKVGERPGFIWKWVYKSSQLITLSIVPKRYQKSVWKGKVLLFMFDTLLDDIADRSQSEILLNELLKIPFKQKYIKITRLSSKKKKYLFFTKKLWNYIQKTIRRYPRYKEFKHIFEYDIAQLLNTMKYAYLVNRRPYLINKAEFWAYLPHNMMAIVCCTVDLMYSPKFSVRELGRTREIFWYAQKMARIGNWVSTWKREIKEGDFTNGVWAYALERNIIEIEDLKKENQSMLVKKIKNSKIEEILLKEWGDNYHEVIKLSRKFPKKDLKKDLKKFLSGLEKFIDLHLISKGYK